MRGVQLPVVIAVLGASSIIAAGQEAPKDASYYPLAVGNTWTFGTPKPGSKGKDATNTWKVDKTFRQGSRVVYVVVDKPMADDEDILNLVVSKSGVVDVIEGNRLLAFPLVAGAHWTSGITTYRVLSARKPCRGTSYSSDDCVVVEDISESPAIKIRVLTTYAKGIGPVRYEQHWLDKGGQWRTAISELRSYHIETHRP